MANGSKLPHSLRIVILLLRLALGLDFFYLGFSSLFLPSAESSLGARSLGDLYAWLHGSSTSLQTFCAWAFLVIGAGLVLGLLMRFMAIAGIALTLFGYWPSIATGAISPAAFVSDAVLVVVCLLVLIFANAGSYLGLDTFLHIHFSPAHKS